MWKLGQVVFWGWPGFLSQKWGFVTKSKQTNNKPKTVAIRTDLIDLILLDIMWPSLGFLIKGEAPVMQIEDLSYIMSYSYFV